MIQLINPLNSPQTVQSKLDSAFKKGYSLTQIKFGFRFFKKEATPRATSYIVERDDTVNRKYVIHKTSYTEPSVNVSYCLSSDSSQSSMDDSLLIDYYQHQKAQYSRMTLRLSIYVMMGLYALMFLTIIPAAFTGWLFLLVFLFLFYRFTTYRAFYKKVFKPLLESTNSIDLTKAKKLIVLTSRKLHKDEFDAMDAFGNFEFSNKKEEKYVYTLLTLSKHKVVQETLDSFDSINTELFATAH